ncbi:MAG: hypothetical protein ABIU20_03720 [Blastocatellia bacterium]
MQRLEIEELVRNSSDVFHGQIVSTETYWNAEHTRIYTGVRIHINETLKGIVKRGDLVKVVQLGGEKDGVRMDYAGRPEFAMGESAVLFTTRNRNNDLTVVALKQGKMRVEGQTVTRDFSGLTLINGTKAGKDLQPLKSSPTQLTSVQLTMDELRQRVARAK